MAKIVTGRPHNYSTYTNHGCRCEICRQANRERQPRVRARLRKTLFDEIPHGTTNGYDNYGCRCDRCTASASAAVSRRLKGYPR